MSEHPPALVTTSPRRLLILATERPVLGSMAEGFARQLSPEDCCVWLAAEPRPAVHELAIQVMSEAGIDIAGLEPTALDSVPLAEVDTVLVFGAGPLPALPNLVPGVRRITWPLDDPMAAPDAERVDAFREMRDEIRWRMASLWPRGD